MSLHRQEQDKGNVKEATREAVLRVLEAQGMELKPHGIEQRDLSSFEIEGEDWFIRLLEDAYYTLKEISNAEFLVEMGDDSITARRPEVLARYRKIRAAGIRMRQLVCEDDTFLLGPVEEYRWIPRPYYKNWVTAIYDNKVAFSLENEKKCIVFEDENLAERRHNDFNLKWSLLPPLNCKSTADERF